MVLGLTYELFDVKIDVYQMFTFLLCLNRTSNTYQFNDYHQGAINSEVHISLC
jgi:hypothetical protein